MTRCDICKKKCGLLNFICSGCKKLHCVTHQLPEEHKCTCIDQIKKEQLRVMQGNLMSNADLPQTKHNYIGM